MLGDVVGKGLAPTLAFLSTIPFVRMGKLRHEVTTPIAHPSKLELREGL